MATSDNYDFSLSRDDIIQDALEDIGVLGEGMAMQAEHINKGARKLNMLIKQISSQADFSYGKKIWARKRGYLFLQDGQVEYNLGPAAGDDHWTDSYVSTTTNTDEAISSTAIGVTSIAGISSGDTIGIKLDDGSIHWDIVNGAPAAGVVTITTGLASAATSGAQVFAYTSKAQRPQRLLTVVRRNTSGEDDPMDEIVTLADYEAISDKDSEGTPLAYHEEPQVDNVRVLIDQAPADTSDVLRIAYHRPMADFDSANDTPDFPAIWYRYITSQLAIDLAPSYGRPVSAALKEKRDEAREIAKHEYAEDTNIFFEPERID